MDSIIRGTNATIQIKIKEDLDFAASAVDPMKLARTKGSRTDSESRILQLSPLWSCISIRQRIQ